MACCFSNLMKFSRITVDAPLLNGERGQERWDRIEGPSVVSCYSLQSWQKWSAITVCALATIAALIGVISIGGVNLMGSQAAWIMIGSGFGCAGLVITVLSTNHLLFIKKINRFLNTQDPNHNDWKNGLSYPGYNLGDCKKMGYPGYEFEKYNKDGSFQYKFEDTLIYGKRSARMHFSHYYFHVDFYRTESIAAKKCPETI